MMFRNYKFTGKDSRHSHVFPLNSALTETKSFDPSPLQSHLIHFISFEQLSVVELPFDFISKPELLPEDKTPSLYIMRWYKGVKRNLLKASHLHNWTSSTFYNILLLWDLGKAALHKTVQFTIRNDTTRRPLPQLHPTNLPHYLPHQVWELNDIRGPCCQITAPCGEFALFKIKEPHKVRHSMVFLLPLPFSTHWGP